MTEQAHTESVSTEGSRILETPNATKRIVVGVDGSTGSLAALDWACQETRLRGGSLHVVMAWQMPPTFGSANVWGLGMDPSMDARTVVAAAANDEAARLGAQVGPAHDVAMTWEAIQGHPARTLIGAAEDAELLVVGSRGHGGFAGALLGSVSQHVVTHAACPVVVVPDLQHAAHGEQRRDKGPLYRGGVFSQAHEHSKGEHGQGVYEQGHAEPAGQGVYDQGQHEVGEGVYEQGRPHPEDI